MRKLISFLFAVVFLFGIATMNVGAISPAITGAGINPGEIAEANVALLHFEDSCFVVPSLATALGAPMPAGKWVTCHYSGSQAPDAP